MVLLDAWISLIQGVGFPITCAIAMFYMLNKEQKEHKEETQQISQSITEMKLSFYEAINELKSEMTTAVNNNTLVMQRLLDKLEENK